ncbi:MULTISPECIES: putative adhesin [unclassified Symbiopectobacterium]|nr:MULTISPECIES: hypothetical protein [unclassified Symbiopectobacterium]MCW2476227.1 hypothetical protein [Candidatus Symbiopectobacterium sp. NZEC151]MCW2482114.1 hypothetical protein [Candidatus Symbiopectobacterium sp. NZEC135]MCW2487233.1 hypothetical protein [Candidatus Symbiopectobacterium sp. NZEC127]
MSPSACKTPHKTVHGDLKPLRHKLRAVSASPLTLMSSAETCCTAPKPDNKRGNKATSRVKKTLLLGGLLLLGGMAWRGGTAGIGMLRSRYQDEPGMIPHGFYPGNESVAAFYPYLPPSGHAVSVPDRLPLAPEARERASAPAKVENGTDAHRHLEVLSDTEHAALAAYLRQFMTLGGWHPDKGARFQRGTENLPSPASRFSQMYDRAKLPAADKPHIIATLSDEFLRFPPQEIKAREPAYAWMVLDMLLLGLGEKETPFRLSYQKLGRASRRRLTKFSHIRYVKQYLDETPPHFAPRRKTALAQQLMKKYASVSRQHAIQHSAYWQANAAGLNPVITGIYDKYYAQLAEHFPPPALNQSHDVMLGRRMLNGQRLYLPVQFTTKEIYLGVHAREALAMGDPSFYFPPNIDHFVHLVSVEKPNIADRISTELGALLSELKVNVKFQRLFEATLDFRAIGIVIHALETLPSSDIPPAIRYFLDGKLNPQLVTMKNNVVPHLLALSTVLDSRVVYISLAHSEVKIADRYAFDAECEAFIRKHLSVFDEQRLTAGELKPTLMCNPDIYRGMALPDYCLRPALQLEYRPHYQHQLYQALVDQLAKNIDAVVYTPDEFSRDKQLMFYKRVLATTGTIAGILLMAVTGPAGAAVWATVGLSSGIGEIAVNLHQAASTDNGVVYKNALCEAQIGAWFLAFGTLSDVIGVGRLSVKQIQARQAMAFAGKRKPLVRTSARIKGNKIRGERRHGGKRLYKNSPDFTSINIRNARDIGTVGYRTLADNHYVQFFTRNPKGARQQGSKTLVISAHGGYVDSDMTQPSIMLPSDITLKMLSPHGTFLEDPGLDAVMNDEAGFRAFLTVRGKKQETHFIPQHHDEWRYADDYQPHRAKNSMGRSEGLQNYRHFHYEGDTKWKIGQALVKNRRLAAEHKATLSDVLIVNTGIKLEVDTDPLLASVQRVIDLDREGQLRNMKGERYNTLVFSHCRCNFALPEEQISTYRLTYPRPPSLTEGQSLVRVTRTTLTREHAGLPFTRNDTDLGDAALSFSTLPVV